MTEDDPFDDLEDVDPDGDQFEELDDVPGEPGRDGSATDDDPERRSGRTDVPEDGRPTVERQEVDLPLDEETGEFVEPETDASTGGPSVSVEETEAGAEAVVPKRSYCERCEFFSSPPSVRCSNPGTEIVELVDSGHFRVVDCPVVEQRGETGFELDFGDDSA